MQNRGLFLILMVSLLASACSTVRTHYDFDPATDFAAWRSYAWYPGQDRPSGDPKLDNPLLHERIEEAVDRTLVAQGFTRAESGEPDFYVQYHLSTEQRLDVQTIDRGYRRGPYGRGWSGSGWGGAGWTETYVSEYDEGVLVIDFIDAPARKLAWRGSGERRLARNPSPETVTKRVDAAVAEILAQFPPEK